MIIMKIALESPSRMVLENHEYMTYFIGAFCIVIGVALAFFLRNPLPIVFGMMFVLVGIFVLVSTKVLTVTLDKATGKGNITSRGIIGSESKDVDLGKVRKITLNRTVGRYSRGAIIYGYFVNFVLDSGESVPFKMANYPTGIINQIISPEEKRKESAKQIADFIGVPMEFVAPSVSAVMSDMKQALIKEAERKPKRQ
jgi:hypothetical protein